jgi:DNA-binding CsgD family transcriptional regulator/tetratricopeptide (TPR) repeat protein
MTATSPHFRPSPLVGRVHEINILHERFRALLNGQGSVLFISGEAGIGKSRLAAEVRRWAPSEQIPWLEARCFEPDRSLPYALLLDLLQSYLDQKPSEPELRAFATWMPDIARLLPELRSFLPVTPPEVLDPDGERQRIVYATRQLVTHLTAGSPLLIILEDLHWSDDASLDVLLHLARATTRYPLLLLGTYRSDEIGGGLHRLLASLDRERLATELLLSPLAPPDVEQFLRTLVARPDAVRSGFVQMIFDLTDGNPFFIEEVIRSLSAAGQLSQIGERWEQRTRPELDIPRSIHDAVLRRTETLSPLATNLLRQAAVAGRTFDVAVLHGLRIDDEIDLIGALRELVDAQLVFEESAERFAFRHALTRQAVYQSLLALERRRLHRAIASAREHLSTETPERQWADLSYHFSAGEVWEKALVYGTQAGRQALALAAPRVAAVHFSRAIEAAQQLSLPPIADLHRDRGQALALVGEFEAAHEDYLIVLTLACSLDDRHGEWQALLDLGNLWAGYDYNQAGTYFEQALAVAHTLDSLPALAASLMQLGSWHLNSERIDLAERSLESALAISEQIDDRAGIAHTIDLLGTVSDLMGDVPRMRRRYERAVTLFRTLGDRQGLSSALATMLFHGGGSVFDTVVVVPHVPTEAIQSEAAEALALARAIDWRAGEAYALIGEAGALTSRGDYAPALDNLAIGGSIAQEIAHREWLTAAHLCRGTILFDLLDLAGAREEFTIALPLADASGSHHFFYLVSGYLAQVEIGLGNVARATDLLTSIAADLPMQTLGQRRVWLARAQLALAQNDPEAALSIIDRLFENALNLTRIGDIPLLALLRGQALSRLDRPDDAEATLDAARHGAAERQMSPISWRVSLMLGQLWDTQGRGAEAREAFRSAWEIIEELGRALNDEPLRDSFLNRAAALVPARRPPLTRQASDSLTRREYEVALLVAQGLSNRTVAEQLSIGERTVETHVSHLLAKLGFRTRAQIAAWVVTIAQNGEAPYAATAISVLGQLANP